VRVARAFQIPMMAILTVLSLSGCMHSTGPVAVAQPRGDLDTMAYGQPYSPPPYSYGTASPSSVADGGGAIGALRSSFASFRQRSYAPATYAAAPIATAPMAAVPIPVAYDGSYRLDAGDKLRVVVYGQEGLTNTYAIDAGGSITMPLIGAVPARGRTPATLASEITAKLRNGYIREPSVAVEIESYRPFFILGEVAAPGQYPYVPNMSVESAVAIAGGFSLTHSDGAGSYRYVVPLGTALGPGDTILVGERWF
jgi:polysaccharide export outer membrane protein